MKAFSFLRKSRASAPDINTGTVIIGGMGIPFTVLRKKRRKRTVAFTVEPGGTIRVLAPTRTSLTFIQSMLERRSSVVLRRMKALEDIGRSRAAPRFGQDDVIRYLGHNCRLHVTQDAAFAQSCRLLPGRFEINIADDALSPEALREEVRTELRLWMKKRAKTKLQKRLDLWAGILGVRYQKLVLAEPEWQWGSCNAQNVIRLNWRLIMADLALIDYVAAHELCHVRHKNHSRRFWGMLENAMPDCMQRRRRLRQTGHGLVL